MKKPTIKNWIKYCAGIFAMSGMLLTTSCDSNNNQTADYENEVEAVENEPTTIERENVAEVDTEAEDTQTADETTTNQTAQNQQASGARSMPNMDSHIEEHKEPNQAIREELTEATDEVGQDDAMNTQGMNRQNVTNTQTGTDYQQTDDMNRQNTTDMNQGTTTDDMNRQNTTNTQGNTSDELIMEEGANRTGEADDLSEGDQQSPTQQSNTLDNQQDAAADYQQTDDINRQNTTDMNQGTTTNDMNQGTTTDRNREDATNATTQESYQYGTDQQQTTQQDTATNQQGTTYDRQSNTEMNQEDEYGTLIIERYSVIIPETYTEEDRQRMEDIMTDYNERRESMRGQMNPETGAYMSPEEEAQPKGMNYEQLVSSLEDRIEYPQNALAAEMEGTVFVRFIVDESGQVRNAEVVDEVIAVPAETTAVQPLNPTSFNEQEIEETKEEMKQEAVKAIESTSGEWEAAMQSGQQVPMELQLPVHFRITDAGPVDNR